jgi:hypothetical protein
MHDMTDQSTSSIFTYQYVDLPKVPEALSTAAKILANDPSNNTWVNNQLIESYHGRLVYDAGKLVGPSTMFQCKKFTTEYEVWLEKNILCNQNIKKVFKYSGITVSKPGYDFSGPHVDASRNFVLLYVVENPNDKNNNPQITKFWTQKKDVAAKNVYDDFSNFELIDQAIFPKHQWVLMNGQCVHSVSNISEGRISLQIALDQRPILQTKEANS